MQTSVYVDGFNLYYGAVKGTPYKWLDIRTYCKLAFPKNTIHEVHYCTAIVQDAPWDPQKQLHGCASSSRLASGNEPAQ